MYEEQCIYIIYIYACDIRAMKSYENFHLFCFVLCDKPVQGTNECRGQF